VDLVVNWLWQGCVVAVAAAALLRLVDGSAAHRYLVAWSALGVVLLLPVLSAIGVSSAPALALAVPSTPVVSMPSGWWTSTIVVLLAWALWSAASGARVALAFARTRRAKARCRPFPPALEARLHHWTSVKSEGRRAALAVSRSVPTAAVLGCGTPVIAVSPLLVRQLTAHDLDRIVIHEWAHVQRRDDVAIFLQLAIRILAGWHPAVWWIDRQIAFAREAACDDAAVGVGEWDALEARHRMDVRQQQAKRVGQRDRLPDRPHRAHRRSSRTTCAISGTISCVMPSVTASTEPGSANTALRPIVPAAARDIIAAAPIS